MLEDDSIMTAEFERLRKLNQVCFLELSEEIENNEREL